MALLHDPGIRMPAHESDFSETSWLISWPDGPWHVHDVEVGGTVLLVDASAQRIVWETRVTHSFAVPYESVGDLAVEILVRWGLFVDTSEMVPGGFAIGWRAEPVARLDRGPIDGVMGVDGEDLSLTGFRQTEHMSDAFNRRWSITDEPEVFCTGRPPMGWFGPN